MAIATSAARGVALLVVVSASMALVFAQTDVKLPKNRYTPEQDVQLGREAAAEVREKYPIIQDDKIAHYLAARGQRLVAAAPPALNQSVYEYSFTPVNLKEINAFALPGGPMFVQRGMFDAAAEQAESRGTTRARSLMRQVEARQFGSTRPQPDSKWRCSGPPIDNPDMMIAAAEA